jgi:hypothetical protein
MTRHHSIALIFALMSALCGPICSTATASPLLSGYGGPGAGEQVIIGSQLLNTPRGGGGTPGAAAKLQSTSQQPATATDSGIPPAQANHPAQTSQTTAAPKFTTTTTTAHADRSPRSSHAVPVPSTPASQPASELGQSTQASYDLRSGLTNGELALIALVVVGLLALAIGTRSLSRLQR